MIVVIWELRPKSKNEEDPMEVRTLVKDFGEAIKFAKELKRTHGERLGFVNIRSRAFLFRILGL